MRLMRAAAATVTLLAILVGVPWLLAATIGNPVSAWPDLKAGDINNTVVLAVLATIAWIAWAQFTIAFLVESFSGIRRSPVPRPLPGIFSFQQLSVRALITAALLLTPAVASVITPTAVAVAAVAAPPIASVPAHASPHADQLRTAAKTTTPVTMATTTVTISSAGPRTWWDLAEQHLGTGQKWAQLWELNQGRPQPAGVRLTTPGPLKPGWNVLVPITTTVRAGSTEPATAAKTTATDAQPSTVTIRSGDSLAAIATRHGLDWTDLWNANRNRRQPGGHVLTDPDYLQPGWNIVIPSVPSPTHHQVTVRPGDTLSGIAEQQHVSLPQLWNANESRAEPDSGVLTNPDYIEPGWTIEIPAEHLAPPPHNTSKPPARRQGHQPPAVSEAQPAATDPDQQPAAHQAEQRAAQKEQAAQHRQELQQRAAQERQAEQRTSAMAAAAASKEAREQQDADTRAAAPTTPTHLPAAVATRTPTTARDDHDRSSLAPTLITAGGGMILTGLVLAVLVTARRRQFRWRRPGRAVHPTPKELLPMERALIAGGRAAAPDVAWLDLALRGLAVSLAGNQAAQLPPLVAARLASDEIELIMGRPTLDPPEPWTVDESGLRWKIARTAPLSLSDDDRDRILAPFPALACVGHTATGEHWLLDLETIGTLSIGGDRDRAVNLARYLSAELAHNTWSDSLQITLVGFGAEMATANPDRLTYTTEANQAAETARIKRQAVHTVSDQASTSVAHGRLHNIAGDTWATHVMIVGPDQPEAVTSLTAISEAPLPEDGRGALSVVLIDPADTAGTRINWALSVDGTGDLTIPALDLRLQAEQLPAAEAADLAALLVLAARTDDHAPAAAQGDQPWDEMSDMIGALAADVVPPEQSGTTAATLAEVSDARSGSVLPLPAHQYAAAAAITEPDVRTLAPDIDGDTRRRITQTDPTLDADLADWANLDSRTPKVTVLGPVDVHAQGALDPQRPRRAWNVEVVTYLATRPHGVTAEKLGADLWPDDTGAHEKSKLRNAISTARRWLGPNPATGRDHLPANPGTPGSVYRVEGVLLDAELFRRLRIRATARGADGIPDLETALHLVTGPPFDALRPGGYGWLADQALDHAYTAMIADVSHLVATHHLTAHHPEKAMAAAQVALLAGSYADEPLLDCAAACYDQGLSAEGATYIKRILANHDAEVEEELPPRTYEILRRRRWLAS